MDRVSLLAFLVTQPPRIRHVPLTPACSWFDADSVHLNDQIPWTVFLPPGDAPLFRDLNMLISRDWTGFNAGVFIIRVCEWSILTLNDAVAIPRLRPEVDVPYRDQDALGWVLRQPNNKRHRIYQPRHWWNQYPEFYSYMGEKVMKGTVQLHFPGMADQRPDSMGYFLDKIEAHSPEVSVPFDNTSYPAEIDAYWARLRSASDMLRQADDYKNEIKEKHLDIYRNDNGKIANMLSDAEFALLNAIEEEAFDKTKMRESVLKLDTAIRDSKRMVTEFIENKEKKEREDRERAAEEAQKKDEQKKKQEQYVQEKNEKLKQEKEEKKAAKEKEESAASEKKEDENDKREDGNKGEGSGSNAR